MKEKIARRLYEMAARERDVSIDIKGLGEAKSWPWPKLSKSSKDYWRIAASQILKEIREEIEKVEIPVYKRSWDSDGKRFTDVIVPVTSEDTRQAILKALES